MTIQTALRAGVAVVLLASAVQAEELRNYWVAPVTTELQRAKGLTHDDTYAVVNCEPLVVGEQIDWAALDRAGLLAALAEVPSARRQLMLDCRYPVVEVSQSAVHQQLQQELQQLVLSAGYQNVNLTQTFTSAVWKDEVPSDVNSEASQDVAEPPTENEYVLVYPVRTQLSKFLYGKVVDCIVEVKRPIDGRMQGISPELAAAIRAAVTATEFPQKQILMYKLRSTAAGSEKIETVFNSLPAPVIPENAPPAVRQVFEARAAKYRPSPALVLAQELGFQRILYSHAPCGGAPEMLVGEVAPGFELESLDGETWELQRQIEGRPAVITFWGLACGPCRREAPWLSAMHDKYGDSVAIVAVNGYGDARAEVAKYVMEAKLTHRILLGGEKLADEVYRVGAYPTTFWVDRQGKVLDYDIGCVSSEQLEAKVQQLLER